MRETHLSTPEEMAAIKKERVQDPELAEEMARAEKEFQDAIIEIEKGAMREKLKEEFVTQLKGKAEGARNTALTDYWSRPENMRKRYRERNAPLSDEIYDIDLKQAVEKMMSDPNISEVLKSEVSKTYWYIGHHLGDGRYHGVAGEAEALACLSPEEDTQEMKLEKKGSSLEKIYNVGIWAKRFADSLKKEGKIE